MKEKPCIKAGRATREKEHGSLRLWGTIPALDPFPVLFCITKKLLFCLSNCCFGFPVTCSPKLIILTDKIPEKKKTKTEKQREIRGSMMNLNIDLVHGMFST